MKRAEVVPDGKEFKVMLGNHEVGRSKSDCDARFHMHAINAAIDEARLNEANWWMPLIPNGINKELEKQRDERIDALKRGEIKE